MIPGVDITDGTRTFTIAPMNLRILLCEPTKELVDRIAGGAGDNPASFQEAAIDLLVACGKRNHPDMTRDNILDAVDAADLGPLIASVMTKSGMHPRPLTPATTPSPQPGQASSASS